MSGTLKTAADFRADHFDASSNGVQVHLHYARQEDKSELSVHFIFYGMKSSAHIDQDGYRFKSRFSVGGKDASTLPNARYLAEALVEEFGDYVASEIKNTPPNKQKDLIAELTRIENGVEKIVGELTEVPYGRVVPAIVPVTANGGLIARARGAALKGRELVGSR